MAAISETMHAHPDRGGHGARLRLFVTSAILSMPCPYDSIKQIIASSSSRGGGHGVIEIIRHICYPVDAVPLQPH